MALDKRQLSVRMALEWAFMTECAQLDLNDGKAEHVKAIGTEYVLMQRMKLGGIRIDGGGRSFPHRDADLIAAGLTRLAMMPGQIRLAISVAEHARAGRVPDWMPGAVAKMEPAEWMPRRGFSMQPMGKSVVIRKYNRYVETPHPKNPKHKIRRRVKVEESWCPCVWLIHPQEIQTARSDYTRWVVALEWLREYLRTSVDLDTIEITDHLPPHRPWAKPNPSGETPLETKSWR